MRRFSRNRRSFRPRGRRRSVIWTWEDYFGVAAAGTKYSSWAILPAIDEDELRTSTNLGYNQMREGFTLVRTIVDLTVMSVLSFTQVNRCFFGLICHEGNDPTINPTLAEVPGYLDRDDDWIWQQIVQFEKNITLSTVVTTGALIDPNKTQVRSMRKLPTNRGIAFSVDNSASNEDVSFYLSARFAMKVPS